MDICLASAEHLDGLSILFDGYRMFYGQASDLEGAKAFLSDRLHRKDSIILVAIAQDHYPGFTQLYPSFSSVSMGRIWILNDLYVAETDRGKGIASSLMDAAETYAKESGAIRVALSTQISNTRAQGLYTSRGYVRDDEFYHYTLSLS